jgi:ABC-type molybdate transport system substrate-binding protein
MQKSTKTRKTIISLGIILASLGLTYAPLPVWEQTIIIVSGTELQEPLKELETKFERENPNIKLELEFQGSLDIANNYINRKNDFNPTILIPANGQILEELNNRWRIQEKSELFYEKPRQIAKTMLVAIAWPERGNILFPNGRFQWQSLKNAMEKRDWEAIGGQSDWGSFDFVMSDPARSNSGQLTLSLWAQSESNSKEIDLNTPEIQSLFSLVKRSVYQPPRSTDILLQEFIARGPNDADVAIVYESIALYRWSQAKITQDKPYQIYYPEPTTETIVTAAIARLGVDRNEADAARKFLAFLTQPQQQEIFIRYGFRPTITNLDLPSVANSPWGQNIPGAEVNPPVQIDSPSDARIFNEIQRSWQRIE